MKKINKILIMPMILSILFQVNIKAELTIDTSTQQTSANTISSALDGQTFEIDKVYTRTEDEFGKVKNKFYHEELDKTVKNDKGETIEGIYEFGSGYRAPIFGYNYIKFTFTPISSDYKKISGSFIVKNNQEPYIETFKSHIVINSLAFKNYKVTVNGKSYTNGLIKNLKSDTEYTIKIYQKANKYMDETLLLEKTVKTKK